jgi:transposase InsO family protein
LRVSEKTVDRWCGIHRRYRWEGLRVTSRRPHIIQKTPEGTVEAVLEPHRTRNKGPCKIEGYLRNYGMGEVKPISHRTIYRILVQAGLNNPISAPRKTWGKRRLQRPYSNNLWQSDFKMTSSNEWMISFLDDRSRFVPGSEIHHNPTGEHAIRLLEDCIRQYGRPDQIFTDQDVQFHPAAFNLDPSKPNENPAL